MSSVATKFYDATRLFAFSSSLCRDPVLLCCHKTSPSCVGIFVTTRKVCRDLVSVFSLFLCRDLTISVATSKLLFILQYVATLNSCVAIRSVH